MSRMEIWKGRITSTKLTPREFATKHKLEWEKEDVDYEEEAIQEAILDEYYEEYVIIKNVVYKLDAKEDEYMDITEVRQVEEGVYEFAAMFYNGGTFLGEVLENRI